jgi:conjugative transposon TraM protein
MKDQLKHDKQRKALLFLPLVVIPFLTLIFWALGGGQPQAEEKKKEDNGLMTKLPDAKLENKKMDKLSYYNAAAADSLNRERQVKTDPYYQYANGGQSAFSTTPPSLQQPMPGNYGNPNYQPQGYNTGMLNQSGSGYSTPESKVYDKINALNAALNQSSNPSLSTNPNTPMGPASSGMNTSDVDRLETMMKSMQSGASEGDPEMTQINSMLEKILDIQNPGRAKEKMNKEFDQKRGQVYLVTTPTTPDPIGMISQPGKGKKEIAGFYSLDESTNAELSNSISAVIHENQTIVSGSIVKMRLLNDIAINGVVIPKDNFIFGEAELSGERLNIKINSIRYKNSQFAVKLNVFDLDGMNGVYIPGAITRDVAKESSSNALSGVGLNGLDQGIGMQAATAGIEFSKSLIGKKIKLIKIFLKAGYRVLLKDDQEK